MMGAALLTSQQAECAAVANCDAEAWAMIRLQFLSLPIGKLWPNKSPALPLRESPG